MASYRHLARIAVLQTLFAVEFREQDDPNHLVEYCAKEFLPKLPDLDFSRSLLQGVLNKKKELYEIIQKYAPEWPVDRIAPIDRAILAIGIYELLYATDVPSIVVINEGVEMAKTYGDINSAKFVNGVLSSVMQSIGDTGKIEATKI